VFLLSATALATDSVYGEAGHLLPFLPQSGEFFSGNFSQYVSVPQFSSGDYERLGARPSPFEFLAILFMGQGVFFPNLAWFFLFNRGLVLTKAKTVVGGSRLCDWDGLAVCDIRQQIFPIISTVFLFFLIAASFIPLQKEAVCFTLYLCIQPVLK